MYKNKKVLAIIDARSGSRTIKNINNILFKKKLLISFTNVIAKKFINI